MESAGEGVSGSSPVVPPTQADLGRDVQAFQSAVDDFDGAAAAVLGINRTDLRCLEVLFQLETALPSQLGARLGLSTGSVTAMLDRLEVKGFTMRAPDPMDRRKVVVRLTPQAVQQVWEEIYAPMVADGHRAVAHYTGRERAIVSDFMIRAREVYERHLLRLRRSLAGRQGEPR
jgi:DNA-binding MarR family transcriptional regulator